MALKLTEAVPWGRLASEYLRMFALTPQDLDGRILDCGGGPSSFTAEMVAQGKQVVSCDPLYQFTAEEIRQRIDETYPRITALTEASKDNFLWHDYGSPGQLGQMRMRAMRLFLDDYTDGKAIPKNYRSTFGPLLTPAEAELWSDNSLAAPKASAGRYITGELPGLPLPAGHFDLALCSHLLFTYSEQFSEEFHRAALVEMLRVATEVRVFPLLTAFSGERSPHLSPVMKHLRTLGYGVEVRPVEYEFQRGGNKMLCVSGTSRAGA